MCTTFLLLKDPTHDKIDSGISLTSTISIKGVSQELSPTGVQGMSPASILPRLKHFRKGTRRLPTIKIPNEESVRIAAANYD
jgi:hypothetical protein